MSEDRYARLRELPFPTVAVALGIDINRYKLRKRGRECGREWSCPCPITPQKRNSTSFSYAADGRWHCFSSQRVWARRNRLV